MPSRQQLLDFIKESPTPVGKREIARAFRISPDDRPALRELLKGLKKTVPIGSGKRFGVKLPDNGLVLITGTDRDGELVGKLETWDGEGPSPRVFIAPFRSGQIALGVGDRILAKLRPVRGDCCEARLIKRVSDGPARILGVYQQIGSGQGRIVPTDRKNHAEFMVAPADAMEAGHGELVLAEILPSRVLGLKSAKITERLGDMNDPRAISLVSIHGHDIPHIFPKAAIDQAEAAKAAPLGARDDLRDIPLITIDGEDARDFDDAVWAEKTKEGWHIIVAIADVAWYVRPGDSLDLEAFKRGNSVYFPDRVVPMLPEALSNGWCSLRPNEDHPCMAVHIFLDSKGNKIRHKFVRGLMRSAARLTYDQVQAAFDGMPDDVTGTLMEPILKPLYGAWRALFEERERRGVLELDLPERKIVLDQDGRIEKVVPRANLESNRLIEDFMIAANVAAAEEIESRNLPCMYRIHDKPSLEKLDGLHDFLSTIGIPLAKGQVIRTSHFNAILEKAKDLPESCLVNEVILRAQAQASYNPENIGHFGLALSRYAHFTSPIRRYADLLVHRALISGLSLGEGGLPQDIEKDMAEIGQHISVTERRAAVAEREAVDRFTAAYLKDQVGASFQGRINGVARFGLFITLNETGADGLIPIATLPQDFYLHDETAHCLVGRRYGARFTLGQAVEVTLAEANPITGGLIFAMKGGVEIQKSGKMLVRNPRGKNKKQGKRRKIQRPTS